jgi:4-diphosphocytidyl-2-C-methyl-D-erythritol kinase
MRVARGRLDGLRAIAASVGADVPSQLTPRPCIVSGAGEVVEPIRPPAEHGVVLIPQTMGLTTPEVYAEADRLGVTRGEAEIESMRRKLRDAVAEGASPLDYPEHLVNDLQPAAISLRPEIEAALEALSEAGAEHVLVTGSGPTAFGLFPSRETAIAEARGLAEHFPGAIGTGPLDPATEIGPAEDGG